MKEAYPLEYLTNLFVWVVMAGMCIAFCYDLWLERLERRRHERD